MAKATAVKSPSKSAAKKAPRTVAVRVVDVSDKPARAKKSKLPVIKPPARAAKTRAAIAVFKVGDQVKWSSSAMGSTTTKIGAVVAVIPGGKASHDKVRAEVKRLSTSHVTSSFGHGTSRDSESYLVSVPQGTTGKAKPKLYWPNAKALSKA